MSTKFLVAGLIFSSAVNVALIGLLVLNGTSEIGCPQKMAPMVAEGLISSNKEKLAELSRLSFRELVSMLTNKEAMEDGYSKRDLALAVLVKEHHFHLEKALGALPMQVRHVHGVELFPALTEEQFGAIVRFAYQEKWPLTAKGLFLHLNKRDASLENAFFVTHEFAALQTLFQKTGSPQEPSLLLDLIAEGSWDLLAAFVKEQMQLLDFSIEKRRALLLNYLALHSKTAAKLLLRTDYPFSLKRLDDRTVMEILTLVGPEESQFCAELARAPRSDAVKEAVAKSTGVAAESPPVLVQPAQIHVVKEGETLWKISRLYKVKVDELAQLNGLEKKNLVPGMHLQLPQGVSTK